MKCPRLKTLQDYLDEELLEKTVKELKDHLAECGSCRDAVARMKSDKDLAREMLRRLDPEGIPMPALGHDSAPATRTGPAHARRPWPVAFLPSSAAGLLMAALFLAGLFLGISLRGGAPAAARDAGVQAPMTFYFSGGNAVRAVSLDLNGYRPLNQPRVILITEERK